MAEEPWELREWIAAMVERLRASGGLSIEILASRSLHEPDQVEAILSGEADLDLTTVFLLAGALEVPPAELLQGISWRPDGERGGRLVFEGDPRSPAAR
jgi:transcriptional regulator with XRE-family HTH domain